MKKVMIILICLLCLSLILYLMLNKTNNKQTESLSDIQIAKFNIKDRAILKRDSDIYVGNNLKELENNFYDIKISNTEYGVVIYLNKLWYATYGNDYIQDEYLARICRELSIGLNVENNEQQFEYVLYKYIKDNYMKIRQNEQVEEILTDKLNIKLELEDNIVKLIIQRGN